MDDDQPSLRRQFPDEYRAWQNMRQRGKRGTASIHPDFDVFEGFIGHVGKKPSPDCTLDRLNSSDPEYGPGKVRWATKREQSNNRRNTVFLTYQGAKHSEYRGETKPLTEWADLTRQNPSTMRRRRSDGWTDTEIVDGERARRGKTFEEMSKNELLNFQPWPVETRRRDELRFTRERTPSENRFAFERRLIEAEVLRAVEDDLDAIARDFSGEPEAFEGVPRDLVYRGWILQDEAHKRRFGELRHEHQRALTMLAENKEQEAHWRRVLEHRIELPVRQARIAREIERNVRDEALEAGDDLYDEEGNLIDD